MAFKEQLNGFIGFVNGKLNNFKNLSLGEQIAFSCVGLGIVLILASVMLFIL